VLPFGDAVEQRRKIIVDGKQSRQRVQRSNIEWKKENQQMHMYFSNKAFQDDTILQCISMYSYNQLLYSPYSFIERNKHFIKLLYFL
jgi:hypothetical protein